MVVIAFFWLYFFFRTIKSPLYDDNDNFFLFWKFFLKNKKKSSLIICRHWYWPLAIIIITIVCCCRFSLHIIGLTISGQLAIFGMASWNLFGLMNEWNSCLYTILTHTQKNELHVLPLFKFSFVSDCCWYSHEKTTTNDK